MNEIGIMQGRLVPPVTDKIQSFPRENWAEEFPRAVSAGLDCIEWIYDLYGESVNPIASDAGIARMRELVTQHGIAVRSLCADYFMDKPFVGASETERAERLEKLEWLMGQCQPVGIARIVLPFVDQSAITTVEEETKAIEVLKRILPVAERFKIELHLETSLGPDAFRRFLARVPHPMLQVNYDCGNSASLGYRPQDEFAAYGERIGSVHIKDRRRGGGTVPLGTGDANFPEIFAGLKTIGYHGDFTLQVARGQPGDEIAWARRNREFVLRWWEKRSHGSAVD